MISATDGMLAHLDRTIARCRALADHVEHLQRTGRLSDADRAALVKFAEEMRRGRKIGATRERTKRMDPRSGQIYRGISREEARRRGLVEIPQGEVEAVEAMTPEERIEWGQGTIETTEATQSRSPATRKAVEADEESDRARRGSKRASHECSRAQASARRYDEAETGTSKAGQCASSSCTQDNPQTRA